MRSFEKSDLYFVFFVSLFAFTFVHASRIFLTLYALKLGAQSAVVGMLAATYSAFPMILSWQAGRIADRIGSRRPLMFAGVCGGCGMLIPYAAPGLVSLFAAAALNGLAFTFLVVATQNLVGLLSTEENRTLNFSNYSLVVSTAAFLGPLFSGFSIDHGGYEVSCLYLFLMALAPVGMLAVWGGGLPAGTIKKRTSGGVKNMLLGSGLGRILTTSSLVITGIALFQFYLPIYGRGIGLSASAIGIVLAMYSAAAFAVRVMMPKLLGRMGVGKMLFTAFLFGTISLIVFPYFRNAVILSMIAFIFGLGMGCGQPLTMMMTFSTSKEGRSGEALGIRITVNHMTRVVTPIFFGFIGSAFGVFPVFWINAALLAVGSAFSRTKGETAKSSSP